MHTSECMLHYFNQIRSIANSKLHKVDNFNELISEFLRTLFKEGLNWSNNSFPCFMLLGEAEDF